MENLEVIDYIDIADKNGLKSKAWVENCTLNQSDWDEFLELAVTCFQDGPDTIRLYPDADNRTKYLRNFFQMEFVGSGLSKIGNGGLVCLKTFVGNGKESKIIGGVCLSTDYTRSFDAVNWTSDEIRTITQKKFDWIESSILKKVKRIAKDFGTISIYTPVRCVHPDFQSLGLGRRLCTVGMPQLIEHHLHKQVKKTILNPSISFLYCNNERCLNFAKKHLGEIEVAELNYNEFENIWVLVGSKTDKDVVDRLREVFN